MGGIQSTPDAMPMCLSWYGYNCNAWVRGGKDALDRMDTVRRAWLIHKIAYNESDFAEAVVEHLKENHMWDVVVVTSGITVQFSDSDEPSSAGSAHPGWIPYTVPPLTADDLTAIGIDIPFRCRR